MAERAVSIVIPTWNGASILAPTLERLRSLVGVAFEVVVVDHGRANRDTEALLAGYADCPEFRYIGLDEQLGFAGAVNHGVSVARHDLIAVICNDVLVEADWLQELVRAHAAAAAAGQSPVLSSAVERPGLPPAERLRVNFWFRILTLPMGIPNPEIFFPDGSAFLFDRQRYGLPFDASYFLYQEDVYLGWRARLVGEEVRRVPTARALNFDGGTTRRTPYRVAYLSERNRWTNYFYFLSTGSLARALPLLLLDGMLKLMAGRNRGAKLGAWLWLLGHTPRILRERSRLQATRGVGDMRILPLLSGAYVEGDGFLPRFFRSLIRFVGLPLGP